MLTSEWYIKDSNHDYRFKLYPGQLQLQISIWDTKEKTIRDRQIYSPYSQFLGKGFNLKEKF